MKEEPFRYRIIVEWSEEDAAYVSRVPALPGVAAHGDTAADAAREARTAAAGALEVMREHGEPLPPADVTTEYSGQIRLRMPRSLHARLDRLAAAEGVSLNVLMVSLLSAGAAERPNERKDAHRLACAEPARSRSTRAKLRDTGAIATRRPAR